MVAPKRVTEQVWAQEADTWRPDLKVSVVAGTPKQRARALSEPADVYAISRDNLADALEFAQLGMFRTLILDELSSFKAPRTKRTKAALKLRAHVRFVWGLTGTPTPNGYMDLWPQIKILDGGQTLGRTLTAYRDRFFTPGRQLASGVITEWLLRPGADKTINKLLEPMCLSMSTLGRVDLPPVTYNNVAVALPPRAMNLYRTMKKEALLDLTLDGGAVHTAGTAAVKTAKLSQLAAGFLYPDDRESGEAVAEVHAGKLSALTEIVEGTGSPILVMYRFTHERDMVRKAFGPLAHTVDEPDVLDAWNAGKIPVLLAHPASVGHGLNLQHGGHTMVWLTLPWSTEEYQQANKRLARQGQKHPVVIHHLLADNTVDRAILDALGQKISTQDALLKHLESPL